MSAIVESLGLVVRQLREAQGWSQEQLAEHSDLNRSYVGEIERGRTIASIVTVEKLSRALGVTLPVLLADCEQIAQRRVSQRINLASIAC
ncbi:helix-turn-helix domain-containing protein [Rhodoferax sp.]|uniref:helix-turn-helix domain-containing protein n=1 Tax=Rhodoferax sp. TaxID=50421 RepID=UPI00374CCFFC